MKLSLLAIASLSLGLSPLLAASSFPLVSAPASGEKSASVYWNGEKFKTNEPPEALPEGALEALAYFGPWAAEMKYVIQLSDAADFMMFTHKKKMSSKEWAKAIVPALEQVDEFAPLPDRESEGVETGGVDVAPSNELSVSWGDVHLLEHEAACFFTLKKPEHMESLLEYIATKEQKEAGWAQRYSHLPGLVIHKPLAGIIVATAPGVEEWDPLNESVNRISRMMLVRRFRTIPFWISLGVAWNVEFDVRGNIYCFPHRDLFVSVAEHNGWRDTLKSQFKKKSRLLDMNQLAGYRVGTYDPVLAAQAWGTISYVTKAKPGALAAIIEDLRVMTDLDGRTTAADGTWERIPNYSPSGEDQLKVFERHLGPDFRKDVSTYFNKGMKKPAKR